VHSYGASGALDEGDYSIFYRLIDVTHEEGLDRIWRDVWKSREIMRGGEMKAHGEAEERCVGRRMRARITWRI